MGLRDAFYRRTAEKLQENAQKAPPDSAGGEAGVVVARRGVSTSGQGRSAGGGSEGISREVAEWRGRREGRSVAGKVRECSIRGPRPGEAEGAFGTPQNVGRLSPPPGVRHRSGVWGGCQLHASPSRQAIGAEQCGMSIKNPEGLPVIGAPFRRRCQRFFPAACFFHATDRMPSRMVQGLGGHPGT